MRRSANIIVETLLRRQEERCRRLRAGMTLFTSVSRWNRESCGWLRAPQIELTWLHDAPIFHALLGMFRRADINGSDAKWNIHLCAVGGCLSLRAQPIKRT